MAIAETVVEEVAANLEEASVAVSKINTAVIGSFLGGTAFGGILGFIFGFRYSKEQIRAEAFQESEAEVAKIRAAYQERTSVPAKPSVEQIIEEKGYSRGAETDTKTRERSLRPPVPQPAEPKSPLVADETSSMRDNWNYPLELARRSPDLPFIIHSEEFAAEEPEYLKVTYTYFEADDVLVDEDNEPILNWEHLVGTNNFRWGHGSTDEDTVFIRNDLRRLDMEVTRSLKSYAVEIQGLNFDEPPGE
jgi:hypothetical protein